LNLVEEYIMNKSRFLRWITVTVFTILIILFGAGWYLASEMMNSAGECDMEHYIYCGDPSMQGIEFKETVLLTEDGVKLKAWFMPGESKRGVVLVHGHGGTIHEGMRYAKVLNDAGFNLIAFQLRGNMDDRDKSFYSMGYHEKKDVKAAVDFMIGKEIKSIGIFGFSMGSSTAILSMADDKRIGAGIFNSGYANIYDQLDETINRDFGLPSFPLVNIGVLLASLRGNIDFDQVIPEGRIASISPRPVFIWHGKKDEEVSFQNGERLFRAAKEPKQFWGVPDSPHVMAWNTDRKGAETRAVEFFDKNV